MNTLVGVAGIPDGDGCSACRFNQGQPNTATRICLLYLVNLEEGQAVPGDKKSWDQLKTDSCKNATAIGFKFLHLTNKNYAEAQKIESIEKANAAKNADDLKAAQDREARAQADRQLAEDTRKAAEAEALKKDQEAKTKEREASDAGK